MSTAISAAADHPCARADLIFQKIAEEIGLTRDPTRPADGPDPCPTLLWMPILLPLHCISVALRGEGTSNERVNAKFDTYRNLQRHRAVLPAIARLSCMLSQCSQLKFLRSHGLSMCLRLS